MRRYHDIGGLSGDAIDLGEHEMEPWQKTLNGTFGALRGNGIGSVDELRRNLEDLPPEQYDLPYFERWAEAITNLLEERGLLTRAELGARMAKLKAELESQA